MQFHSGFRAQAVFNHHLQALNHVFVTDRHRFKSEAEWGVNPKVREGQIPTDLLGVIYDMAM